MTQLIKHHVKYEELHGVDEVVLMTRSEHKKLHNKLRNEGKCNLLPNEIAKYSKAASGRDGTVKKYSMKNIRSYKFTILMIPYINLRTAIRYNVKLDSLSISSWFEWSRPNKITFKDI